jgi:hypothetical protein
MIAALNETTIGGLPFEEVRREWDKGSSENTDTLLQTNFRSLPAAASSHLSRSGIIPPTPTPSPLPNLDEMTAMDTGSSNLAVLAPLVVARKSVPSVLSGLFSRQGLHMK